MALLSRHGHSHGRSSGKATKRIELTARAFAAVREMTCVVAGVEVPASMAEKMIIDGDGIETRVVDWPWRREVELGFLLISKNHGPSGPTTKKRNNPSISCLEHWKNYLPPPDVPCFLLY